MDIEYYKKICRQCISEYDACYNLTICPNDKHFDCIESWHIEDSVLNIAKMSIKETKKTEVDGFRMIGAYEKFPNNPTKAHVHCQLYINWFGRDDNDKRSIINKFHGMLNKQVGNTKIAKNLPYTRLYSFKLKCGVSTDMEYKEYYDYMFKQTKCHQDLFEVKS